MKSGLLACLLMLLSTGYSRADNTPLVAVASSLRQVWPLLLEACQCPQQPRVTFGSSGNLARQIVQGAPFELFLSADQSFPQWLIDNGKSQHPTVDYTQGKLAWVALPDTLLASWLLHQHPRPAALASIPKQIKRLAIANPAFAPYGRAAKTVLAKLDNHPTITLALGENAVQALQFALSGATDGGIVPLSLLSDSARTKLPAMVTAPIDAIQHAPLVHSMILIGEPSLSAIALFDFLLSEPAQTIFVQNGFAAVE